MAKTRKEKAKRREARLHAAQFEKALNNPPRSMVFRRGDVGESVRKLVKDLRLVMSPFTALKLRESKKNTLSDFLKTATPLNVTHFMMLSQTAVATNLRIARIPRGPTITFRVLSFSTIQAVRQSQKNPHSVGIEYNQSPLVVLNNFSSDDDNMKVTAAVLQNMFPGLDLSSLKLNTCRRVVLFNYNSEDDTIDFRHYHISAVPVGLTKSVRKVIKGQIPQIRHRDDIADWVENPNSMSDSEAEFDQDSRVQLPQDLKGRGNVKSHTSAIKLKELGPRMKLELYKIEDGFCGGQVLYNRYVNKTEEEIQEINQRKEDEVKQKAERKRIQEENVKRKEELKLAERQRQIEMLQQRAAGQHQTRLSAEESIALNHADVYFDDDSELDQDEDDDQDENDIDNDDDDDERGDENFSNEEWDVQASDDDDSDDDHVYAVGNAIGIAASDSDGNHHSGGELTDDDDDSSDDEPVQTILKSNNKRGLKFGNPALKKTRR